MDPNQQHPGNPGGQPGGYMPPAGQQFPGQPNQGQPFNGQQFPGPNQPFPGQQPNPDPNAGPNDQGQPHYVFMSRPAEPQKLEISEDTMRKHTESKRRYPHLNLSEGEFVISAINRHVIGLFGIWAATIFVIVALFAVFGFITSDSFMSTLGTVGGGNTSILVIPVFLLTLLALIIGFIASYVYNANKFYLTNESVIQIIQTSLFSRHEQTVSLINVEDASFAQHGIIQYMFGYGTIRLSTEGEETTYRYSFAPEPKKHIAVLNNAVEAFKNGRPVVPENHHSDY